jgi:CheY-like chemotaxis protein
MRVLVVEADAETREVVAEALAAEGAGVIAVAGCEQALEELERHGPPDVIVVDDWTRRQCCPVFASERQLDDRLRAVPVVLLTSIPPASSGLADCTKLRKPFGAEELVDSVRTAARAALAGPGDPTVRRGRVRV